MDEIHVENPEENIVEKNNEQPNEDCPLCGEYSEFICDNDCESRTCFQCEIDYHCGKVGHNPSCEEE